MFLYTATKMHLASYPKLHLCRLLSVTIIFDVTTLHTGTADDSLETATVAVLDRFGWTTFTAMARRLTSRSVHTTAGAFTTVDMAKTSPSRATPVLFQLDLQ